MPKKKLAGFRPQRNNVNKHKPNAMALLDKSIRGDGWMGAITTAADGEVFAGSARLETAAEVMGESEPIIVETDGTRPIIVRRTDIPNADDPRAKRLGVADNSIAAASWNPDGDLLAMLAADDEAISAMVRNDDTAARAVMEASSKAGEGDAEPQIDRAEELREKWQTERGQLWAIGEHRLLCGDSTAREDVERVMGGEKIDCLFTSPPYNQGATSGDLSSHRKTKESLYKDYDDKLSEHDYMTLLFGFCNACLEFMSAIHSVVINMSYNANARDGYGKFVFSDSMPYKVKETIIWDKKNALNFPNAGIYSRRCELIFVMSANEKYLTSHEYGTTRWNYWDVSKEAQMKEHRAAFPLSLAERAVGELSLPGSLVYEPFCGTGTTLVACQNLNRKARAIEISPAYCAVILERMAQAFPGIEIKQI